MRNVIFSGTSVLFLFGLLVTLSPTPGHAQGGPTSAIDIPMSDIETVLAVENGGTDRQIRIVDMGSYNLAVGVIHRGATQGSGGPVRGIMHSLVTETYVIISGDWHASDRRYHHRPQRGRSYRTRRADPQRTQPIRQH